MLGRDAPSLWKGRGLAQLRLSWLKPQTCLLRLMEGACAAAGDPSSWDLGFVLLSA